MCYLCAVTCQRRSPFGSRSMFDRFPLVLRYFFVRPSFVLRSVSVREARCNGDVTDKEKIRNKPEYKSQRSLISFVTRNHRGKEYPVGLFNPLASLVCSSNSGSFNGLNGRIRAEPTVADQGEKQNLNERCSGQRSFSIIGSGIRMSF